MQQNKNPVSPNSTTTVTERLIEFITKKGISRNAFYAKTGVGNGTLDTKSGMTTKNLAKVLEVFPDLNLYWLVTGKQGDIEVEPQKKLDKESETSLELFKAYKKLNEVRDRLEEAEKEIEDLVEETRIKDAQISDLSRQLIELEKRLAMKNTKAG